MRTGPCRRAGVTVNCAGALRALPAGVVASTTTLHAPGAGGEKRTFQAGWPRDVSTSLPPSSALLKSCQKKPGTLSVVPSGPVKRASTSIWAGSKGLS